MLGRRALRTRKLHWTIIIDCAEIRNNTFANPVFHFSKLCRIADLYVHALNIH